jgi:hypothetical protein
MKSLMHAAVAVLLVVLPAVAKAEMTADNRLQITRLVKQADALDRAGDPVGAWRHLSEAERLERLWSGNTLGDDGAAAKAWNHYAAELIKREDGGISKVLHSEQVALNDKLNLLRRLEDEVAMNHRVAP